MATQTFIGTLQIVTCCTCGMTFGMTSEFKQMRRDDQQNFYCPAGHPQFFSGKTDAQKLKEAESQLKSARDNAAWYEGRFNEACVEVNHQKRRVMGYKGALAKTQRRVGRGQCPCCSMRFTDLKTHMAQRHPGWNPEKHAEALAE